LQNQDGGIPQIKENMKNDIMSNMQWALVTAGGNKSKAARLLKISRMTIYRLMKKLEKDVSP
jgi:transcriptional regulator of acetoin/glycerol metabolism